jgi:primase-polymerase (primpol)-like protein
MVDKINGIGKAQVKDESGRPRALEVIAEQIPADMQAISRWVVWKCVKEVDKETGKVEWNKPPVNARTGKLASSTNPDTWCTFDEALAAYRRGDMDGVGFVLHREQGDVDGLVGVDLDHCRDPETCTIEPWALEIVRTIDSYTEVSPSGCGLRIFLYGNLPPQGRKEGDYENYQTGRYVTVTGHHVEGTPQTIEARQDELKAVHRKFWPEKPETTANGTSGGTPTNLDDAEIVRRASEARNGAGAKFAALWGGDASRFKSRSEADLALCSYLGFWCGPDASRIADMFAQSGLYRSKWNREDYRNRTISKALAGRTEFYTPTRGRERQSCPSGPSGKGPGPAVDSSDPAVHLTDRGNALRLVKRHGENLVHCHPWRKWIVWDETRWRLDDVADVMKHAKETIVDLFGEASSQIAEIRKALEEIADG